MGESGVENLKIGLVIQGPLISGGLTGATWGKGKTRAPRDHFVEFDCVAQLRINLKEIRKYFPMTIISTWDHFDTKSLEELDSSLVILKNPEPANLGNLLRKPVEGMPDVAHNNRYKQFESLNYALEHLSNTEGITHFIKIRTDQVFNWQLLRDEVHTTFQRFPRKLFLPYRHEGIPFLFPDFYFGGSIKELRDFINFVGNRKFKFHENIHRDMALKFLFLNEPTRHLAHYADFFLSDDKCTEYICNELDLLFKNRIALGTRELFYSILWRGEKLTNSNLNFRFSGDIYDAKCTHVNQNRLDIKNFLRFNNIAPANLPCIMTNWIRRNLEMKLNGSRTMVSSMMQRFHRQSNEDQMN
jgi:hypothetical protein